MNPVDYFKALGDQTRLRLLNLLLHREYNVNELVEILSMGQSRVSRHLRILTDAGLLTVRRNGLWAFYRVAEHDDVRKLTDVVGSLIRDPSFDIDLHRAHELVLERQNETRRFFDSMAEDWDAIKRNIIGSFDLTSEIIDRVDRCGVAVDLGCGTGDLLPALLTRAEKAIGVDNSPEMLKKADTRFVGRADAIDLRIGQLEHLPLRDGEADVGVINMVLHHLPEPSSGIGEGHRALSRGGSLIVVELETHQRESMRTRYGDRWLGFPRADMERWFEAAGFEIGECTTFPLQQNLTALLYHLRKAAD